MSSERSSWDDIDPAESTQRRKGARTTDDLGMPPALRAELEAQPIQMDGEFDFEDVGPTEMSDGAYDPMADVPTYERLRAGETMGRYRIDRLLGHGATGVVYEASHVVVGRRVALKCLFPHVAMDPVQVKRLFREAKISARVEHDNVVQIFDGGRDKGTYFLAMELLEGRSFAEMIEEGPRPVAEVVDIMLKAMAGVAAVHAEGVIHRDLKPDNIFLQMIPEDPLHPGNPKVLDFGVSKLKEPGMNPSSKLTAMGMMMGTPYYMAPEQVADTSSVDQRADVYSLGVILYEALTGKLPYEGHSVVEIFTQSSEGRPKPLRGLRPDVPPSLEALVARVMCPDKASRYPSVEEMRAALAAVPLDAPEAPEQWADVSQPWMLDKASGVVRKEDLAPIEVEPTQALVPAPGPPQQPAQPALPASMPTPISNPRPPIEPPGGAAGQGWPTWAWVLLAAALGGGFAALGAVALYFALA